MSVSLFQGVIHQLADDEIMKLVRISSKKACHCDRMASVCERRKDHESHVACCGRD